MIKCYAAYTKSKIREKCSSGGIYAELASHIINCGGIVYASVYNKDFSVSFKRISDKFNLENTYGSKYTQSQLGFIFREVKQDLESKQTVLFCGLPCQVAGLKNYLQTSRTPIEKLYLVDLFCHGEPSSKVWTTYVKQNFEDQKLIKVNMRNKKTGWSYYNYCFEYTFEDHTKFVHNGKELYMQGYLENLYTKPSCFSCMFKGNFSLSDVTLGDFWGVDKTHPNMDDNKGTSVVIAQTKKGINLIQKIFNNDDINICETTMENIISFDNGCIRKTKNNPLRHKFLVDCSKTDDINSLILKNINITGFKKYKNKIIKTINYILEKFLHKEKCVGCTACANICNKDAIKMKQDEEGFWYPKVDAALCVGCKACLRACPVNNPKLNSSIKTK